MHFSYPSELLGFMPYKNMILYYYKVTAGLWMVQITRFYLVYMHHCGGYAPYELAHKATFPIF